MPIICSQCGEDVQMLMDGLCQICFNNRATETAAAYNRSLKWAFDKIMERGMRKHEGDTEKQDG